MPLYKRKPYCPRKSLPSGLDIEEDLYVVGCTGEGFREYEDYLAKMKLYKSRVWSCAYTGKSALTYEEALEEEAKATALLTKVVSNEDTNNAVFPDGYEEKVIRFVHHSTSRLEEIVNRVYEDLRPEENSEKENCTKKTVRHPIPRSVLRRWIQEYAKEVHVNGVRIWVASPEMMKVYGLPTTIPLEDINGARKLTKKKKPTGTYSEVSTSRLLSEFTREKDSLGGHTHLPENADQGKFLPQTAKPGGLSHTAFLALWDLGPQGGRVEDIVRVSLQKGSSIEWNPRKRKALGSALCHNASLFSRVSNGLYTLRMYTDCKPNVGDHFSQSVPAGLTPRPSQESVALKEQNLSSVCLSKPSCHLQDAVSELERAQAEAQTVKWHVQSLLAQLHALDGQLDQNEDATNSERFGNEAKRTSKDNGVLLKSRNDIKMELRNATMKLTELEHEVEHARNEVTRKQVDVCTNNVSLLPSHVEMEMEDVRKKHKEQKRLEAKRYPIDDLQLLEENLSRPLMPGTGTRVVDVYQSSRLSSKESIRTSGLLYISEFLSHFGKSLDLKPLTFQELSTMVIDGSFPEYRFPKNQPICHIGNVYEKLLDILLDEATIDGKGSRVEQRWYYALGPGTWPEVLRRYVLSSPYAKNLEVVTAAANVLGTVPVQDMSPEHHLELLEYLCDEALTSEEVRNLIQKKIDAVDNLGRDMRTELAEGKQKLRELLDAQKEEKKRKREEQISATKATAAADVITAVASLKDASPEDAEGPDTKKIRVIESVVDDSISSMEPPQELKGKREDLQNGRKSLSSRQIELAERKKLVRAQRLLEAEERKKMRVLEMEEKARKQEEAQAQREIKHAEEDITRVQEVYEKQIKLQAVRSDPLGLDRYYRNYWWGLGSHKSAIFVEDSAGNWGSLNSLDQVEKLRDSLNTQGIRECHLLEAINKKLKTIEKAMKPTVKNSDCADKLLARKEFPRRTPRHAANGEKAVESSPQPFGNINQEAIAMIKDSLDEIYNCGIEKLFDGPPCGWKSWRSNIKTITAQFSDEESDEVRPALISTVLELETFLVGGTGESDKYQDKDSSECSDENISDSEANENSNVESIAEDSASECQLESSEGINEPEMITVSSASSLQNIICVEEYLESEQDYSTPSWCVWNGAKERKSWQDDLSSAKLLSHVAYSVASLAESTVPAMKDYYKMFSGKKARK